MIENLQVELQAYKDLAERQGSTAKVNPCPGAIPRCHGNRDAAVTLYDPTLARPQLRMVSLKTVRTFF